MKHTYKISGMTCAGCISKVSFLLSQHPSVKNAAISLEKGEASIEMEKHIPTPELQDALKEYPKYQLSEKIAMANRNVVENTKTDQRTWLQTYKPILVIFFYILAVSLIAGYGSGTFNYMASMRIFMAGFFLAFSFFKMLDLKGFAESYSMYDVVARKFKSWGYIYAFLELGLGFAFALNFQPCLTNIITLVVMSVSIVGVLKSVLDKKKIQCACLGAVFNLPMSTVTIIEDGLMILMSLAMLLML
ncbi:MAG TPA: MauE/DoxX family redox-associated membrane protein [Flavobacterium sp.]|nr:MauE/DoxX family redox-associated membrane protein [Flavobacterium sp.]